MRIITAAFVVALVTAFGASGAIGESASVSKSYAPASGSGAVKTAAFQCAVRAGSVSLLGGRVQTWLENRCNQVAVRMTANVCLMRKASPSASPVAFACNSKDVWGTNSVTVSTSKLCNYTTYPYTWYARGYGTATLSNGGTHSSPVITGPELIYQCN